MSFPEPAIKDTAPQGAEFLWFPLLSTGFEGIWCFLARAKQQARPASNIWNRCPIPTICHIYSSWYQKFFWTKKKENLSTAKPLVIFFPLKIAAILWLCLWQSPYIFFFACWYPVSSVIGNVTHSVSIHETSFSPQVQGSEISQKQTCNLSRREGDN